MRRVKVLWIRMVRKFRSERFFQIRPPFRGPGWYFDVREGEPWGPYSSLEDAKTVAGRYVQQNQTRGDEGGREDRFLIGANFA